MKSVQRPGAWVSQRWWDQERVDLGGEREISVAALDGEEEKRGEEAVQEETTGRS